MSALIRSRYPVAIASGILLALSFPSPGIAGLAWIAPAFILAITLGTTPKQSFRLGYVAGVAWHLTALRWLLLIPVTGFPILGWMALSAFLGLYTGAWTWLVSRLLPPTSLPPTPAIGQRPLVICQSLASIGWAGRFGWTLACAALWVAFEFIQGFFLGGFPWNPLAASQYRILPLVQVASITGVHGVSFLMIWSSAALVCAAAVILSKPGAASAWAAEIFPPFLALAACFAFGFHVLRQPDPQDPPVRITMVQPSIPQTLIWSRANADDWFQGLLKLTETALDEPTDLLLWPESAIPGALRYDAPILTAVTNIAVKHGVWMIVASDDAEPSRTSSDPKDVLYFNSCFLVNPDGEVVNRYIKRNLVIFGEYIPFEHTLPIMKWFTPVQGSFTPGSKPVSFQLTLADGRRVEVSPLICFEDVFPALGRQATGTNTDFLVNLTNDGWFGESAAQWQQAAAAEFRSIENRVPLVRCTNTGLTCWFDAKGRLHDVLRDAHGRIYGPGWIRVEVPVPPRNGERPQTFYNRHGDWLGWGCVVLAAVRCVRFRRQSPATRIA